MKRLETSYSNKSAGIKILLRNFIIATVLAVGMFFVILKFMPQFEKEMPNDQGWAVAVIAIPIAFFAIFISTQIFYIKKMEEKITVDTALSDLYVVANNPFDMKKTAIFDLAAWFICWVFTYIWGKDDSKYAVMIADAFYMTFFLLYLISYNIYYVKKGSEKMFVSFFMNDFKISDTFLIANMKELQKCLDEEDDETFCEKVEQVYITKPMLCLKLIESSIVTNTATDVQKNAFILLLRKVSEKKSRGSNLLLISYLFCLSKKALVYAYNNRDCEFFMALCNAILYSCNMCDKKISKLNKMYKRFILDEKCTDNLTMAECRSLKQAVVKGLYNYVNEIIALINNKLRFSEMLKAVDVEGDKSSVVMALINPYIKRILLDILNNLNELKENREKLLEQREVLHKEIYG